jgi:hypothetical protein
MFSAPGELDDGEIIMIDFLLDEAEVVPQLAICEKEAQPFAFVALAVVIQDLFDVHETLPVQRIKTFSVMLIRTLWKNHHSAALSTQHGSR